MTFTEAELVKRRRESIRRARATAVGWFGGCCMTPSCGRTDRLEFAHIRGTDLRGEGRGSWERVHDVLRHPKHYLLFCHDCHLEYDKKEGRKGKAESIASA
jgi:transposase